MRLMRTLSVLAILSLGAGGMARAQLAAREHGHFAEVNGSRLYYEDRGQGEPLFLLHEFFGTASRWDGYVDELASEYRVIAWDMRGHGRSSYPDSADVFLHKESARDLLDLMDHLEIDRARAVGVSSGGMTLLYAATMAPQRFEALVIVGAQTHYSAKARKLVALSPFLEDPEVLRDLNEAHGESQLQQLGDRFKRCATQYGDPSFTPDLLATISARALIVQGDNDGFVPVSQSMEMFNAIPRAHLWIVPNGGHLVHLVPENRDDFLRRVSEFLEGQWEEGPR